MNNSSVWNYSLFIIHCEAPLRPLFTIHYYLFTEMKSFLLSLAFLVSSVLLCLGQQTISNPVSLGPILTDQINIDRMVDLCKWYKLAEVPSDDDYHTYKHEDGTLIKFRMSDDKIPYVEIYTNQSKKNIEKKIMESGYEKDTKYYIKGSKYAISYKTAQIIGNKNKHVIFTIQKNTTN